MSEQRGARGAGPEPPRREAGGVASGGVRGRGSARSGHSSSVDSSRVSSWGHRVIDWYHSRCAGRAGHGREGRRLLGRRSQAGEQAAAAGARDSRAERRGRSSVGEGAH